MLSALHCALICIFHELLCTVPMRDGLTLRKFETTSLAISRVLQTCGTASFLSESLTVWKTITISICLLGMGIAPSDDHINIFSELLPPTDLTGDHCQQPAFLYCRPDLPALIDDLHMAVDLLRDVQIHIDVNPQATQLQMESSSLLYQCELELTTILNVIDRRSLPQLRPEPIEISDDPITVEVEVATSTQLDSPASEANG